MRSCDNRWTIHACHHFISPRFPPKGLLFELFSNVYAMTDETSVMLWSGTNATVVKHAVNSDTKDRLLKTDTTVVKQAVNSDTKDRLLTNEYNCCEARR